MTIEEFNAKRTKVREEWISKKVEEGTPRLVAAMEYDHEVAPMTTNRLQLLEMGIDVGDNPSREIVQQAIDVLGQIGVFFVGTEHVSENAFTAVFGKVIDDKVPDLPANPDCVEFIEMSNSADEGTNTFVFPVCKLRPV